MKKLVIAAVFDLLALCLMAKVTYRQELLKLAQSVDANPRFDLGNCHDNCVGVLQNYSEAVRWWRLAAEQSLAWAQHHLGCSYKDGCSINISNSEAYFWFVLASMDPLVGERNRRTDSRSNAPGQN